MNVGLGPSWGVGGCQINPPIQIFTLHFAAELCSSRTGQPCRIGDEWTCGTFHIVNTLMQSCLMTVQLDHPQLPGSKLGTERHVLVWGSGQRGGPVAVFELPLWVPLG